MSGFDRRFRTNVLCWGTRAGSRLSGCPEPMRRTAPYVIGEALRFRSEGFFILASRGRVPERRFWTKTRKTAGLLMPGAPNQLLALESRMACQTVFGASTG